MAGLPHTPLTNVGGLEQTLESSCRMEGKAMSPPGAKYTSNFAAEKEEERVD